MNPCPTPTPANTLAFNVSNNPLHNSATESGFTQCQVVNVTAQKQVDKALAQKQGDSASIVPNADQPMVFNL